MTHSTSYRTVTRWLTIALCAITLCGISISRANDGDSNIGIPTFGLPVERPDFVSSMRMPFSDWETISQAGGEGEVKWVSHGCPLNNTFANCGALDFNMSFEEDVLAVAAGEVAFSGLRTDGFGEIIIISHSGGFYSIYAHLSKRLVHQKGTPITQGQHIGEVGGTGGVPVHLHFGVSVREGNGYRAVSLNKAPFIAWNTPSDPNEGCGRYEDLVCGIAWASLDRVHLFESIGYNLHRGTIRFDTTGHFDILNERFQEYNKSLHVPEGWSVTLFENSERTAAQGGHKTFLAGDPDLRNDRFNNGRPIQRIRSISITRLTACLPSLAGADATLQCGGGSPPPPSPQPPTPIVDQGIAVISVSPAGNRFNPGQQFNLEVVVQTSGVNLSCGQGGKDFLEHRGGDLFGSWPIIGCESQGGGRYRFFFNTPMRAPDAGGSYRSQWQIWQHPRHIGPMIDISFNVGTPRPNSAPSIPRPISPDNWAAPRQVQAPELCWAASTDADGDTVRYYAEVFGSARIDNSGWTTNRCWRPANLDGHYYTYQWRVKTRDDFGGESPWSETRHFSLDAPPFDPAQPTSTPRAAPSLPRVSDSWWHRSFAYRRMIPIATDQLIAAGTIVKVDRFDLDSLVRAGLARADRNDIRVAHRHSDGTWQEVARQIHSPWDLEFQLLADIPPGTDHSYYLYYGHAGAGVPPTLPPSPQGFWVDYYIDKWWSSYKTTATLNQAMDFNHVCDAPVEHRQRAGSAFDDSNKFRGRIFIPSSGTWSFSAYTNDGFGLILDGVERVRDENYGQNRWVSLGSYDLKAGWHSIELRNMWVNCGAWKFAMSGPGFNGIVPAEHFQRLWGAVVAGVMPGFEETQAAPYTPTPTNTATPTSTPVAATAPSFAGDGSDGDRTVNPGDTFVPNTVRSPANASGTQATLADAAGFAVGDAVLLHQTQGGPNVGRWEVRRVIAVSGGTLTLDSALDYSYSSTGSNRAQAVRILQYRYLTVLAGGSLRAPAWDGSTGGILAVMCRAVCTLDGVASTAGLGFRGGAAYNVPNQPQFQGEGSAGAGTRAQAANGNGGGGGHSEFPVQAWTGGAGGGHRAAGASVAGRNGALSSAGGQPAGNPELSIAVFGGGGGGYTSQVGGAGGGLQLFLVNELIVKGEVRADGANGTGQGGGSTGSGGGAGGAILIRARSVQNSGTVTANGGRGGPSGLSYQTPGGDGSPGRIRIEYCTGFNGTTPLGASVQAIDCTESPGVPSPTPTATATAGPPPPPSWVGDGRDGPMPASGNLDANNGVGLGVASGAAGTTTINVVDNYAVWRIRTGDYVLIHQTRGTGAGAWELNVATNDFTGSGSFNLAQPLQHTYTSGGFADRAQIMRVPQYSTCAVTGTITPLKAWDGDTGGILAVMCQGRLEVSGALRADGVGFRGGDSGNGYATDQWAGEGVLCRRNTSAHLCKSPERNVIDQGGGPADGIGGGGGGGGFSPGSDGDHIGGSTWGLGGLGYGSPDGSRIFFGGGGGGGATSINPGTGSSSAGRGGGVIFIFAQELAVSGEVSARGAPSTGVMYDDGQKRRVTAGSGGGGQLYLRLVRGSIGTGRVLAPGGPQNVPPAGGTGRFGGGAGGEGHVRIEYCESLSGTPGSQSSVQQLSCGQ